MINFFKALLGIPNVTKEQKIRYITLPSNDIDISMSNPNEPPFIKVKGKQITKIIDVRYNYSTATHKCSGSHNFTIVYIPEGKDCIETIVVENIEEMSQ